MERALKILLVTGMIVGCLLADATLRADSECGDPFEGEDVRFSTSGWITDFCKHDVPYSEIRSGGVPRDGIPPIYSPVFESVESASEWLQPQSPVIAVEIDGEARAYPLAILTWHEIVNDTLGDVPIAVTYCPLCNASIVFDRRVNGQVRTFGVSGNLRNSDLIMWDHETESWWQQFTGEGIVGAHVDDHLTMLPSQIVGFGDFAEQFPDGEVLSRDTGFERSYGSNPYTGYDSAEQPFLFDGEVDSRLPATERVLAGMIENEAVAYPFSVLSEQRVINDTAGGMPVVAFWQGGVTSALDAESIDESRDIGTAALYRRELDGRTLTFTADTDGTIHDAETGSTWNVFGRATAGELAERQLELQLAAPHLWFAWAAFRPETRVYGQE